MKKRERRVKKQSPRQQGPAKLSGFLLYNHSLLRNNSGGKLDQLTVLQQISYWESTGSWQSVLGSIEIMDFCPNPWSAGLLLLLLMKGMSRYETRWAETLPACVWGHPPSLICRMALACCQRHPQVTNRGRQLQLEHREVLRYNFALGEVVVWKCRGRGRSASALQRAALPGTAELALEELLAQEGQLWCTSNTG